MMSLTTDAQHSLFNSGLKTAEKVARFLIRRLKCKLFDLDDARQHSLMGLMQAAAEFDATKATCPFERFSATRCYQRIIDGYRKTVGRGADRLKSAVAFSEIESRRNGTHDDSGAEQILSLKSRDLEPLDAMIARSDAARKRKLADRAKALAAGYGRKGVYRDIIVAMCDFDMPREQAAALYGYNTSAVSRMFESVKEALCA
jgi:DNA-directed RNA polymerase specialized sigma subunit